MFFKIRFHRMINKSHTVQHSGFKVKNNRLKSRVSLLKTLSHSTTLYVGNYTIFLHKNQGRSRIKFDFYNNKPPIYFKSVTFITIY